ncbi:mitochondrial 2-oxodicarboxylate carrier 1 [Spathaspora passalidarum NRRL Y-27907]|uniref:Mitochondrial thiamine pyrophosphate carrier 1 n=1 Tax=Spathaspora passalidarum (strain NRRL Y-27907 / 11-Y1) TaxID=619300 RepID=G3AHI5_SPAPN|nr:mitochondrial 2-oxodicarboxylate carrier 1 [Spathaspora passalidarum NRRL Y-27907]EGW34149.1 mitochondrial 2-oxodicarboxylate carrier 1 [Spathaspora passalidarum NRRL Y-27907]
MSAPAEKQPLPFFYNFLAGAIAGVSEIIVMYPLDVIKTRQQLDSTGQYKGTLDCLKKIVKEEGFSRLYKGIAAPILMEAPKRATKFAANDEWGKFYRKQFEVKTMTQPLAVLTGATAGATESLVVVPFELVKIRLQDKTTKFNGMGEVVKHIVKENGLLGLYKGTESTAWRHIWWNAGYFGCIHQLRSLFPKPKDATEKTLIDLTCGAIGGTVGTILNTPFDVVKSRIQAGSTKYKWTYPSLAIVAKEEGFGALYKGFIPKVLRLGPGGGILLVVFTACMDFFRTVHEGK